MIVFVTLIGFLITLFWIDYIFGNERRKIISIITDLELEVVDISDHIIKKEESEFRTSDALDVLFDYVSSNRTDEKLKDITFQFCKENDIKVGSKEMAIYDYIKQLEDDITKLKENEIRHDFSTVDEIKYDEFTRTLHIKGYTYNDVLLVKKYNANTKLVKDIESNNNYNKFGGLK